LRLLANVTPIKTSIKKTKNAYISWLPYGFISLLKKICQDIENIVAKESNSGMCNGYRIGKASWIRKKEKTINIKLICTGKYIITIIPIGINPKKTGTKGLGNKNQQ
tara:strand:- start:4227 stop:4547 length:321 start_codon:yes stop_codon:yes gene_type:complete